MGALLMRNKNYYSIVWISLILFSCAFAQIQIDESSSSSSNVPLNDISNLLIQSALNFLNDNSPTQHSYKHGTLISAQKLAKPPYIIYRLTFNLEPNCRISQETCSREACTLDIRQHEHSVIDVLENSIQCMYMQSKAKQENVQDQEVIENIEKQIINQSFSLDHEIQTSADHNDRPFIAVRATQSEYCPGCPYELNPSLSGLSAFRDQVLNSMDEAGISDFKHKLISIVRVTRVVPPGLSVIQYQLLMEIGESNCLKTSHIEVSECSLQSNLPIKLCYIMLEENSWQINSRKIIKNNCTDLLNTDNEVSASVDPNLLFIQSASLHKEDDVSKKTEFYDQIAQEAQEVVRVPSMDISIKDSIEATKELPQTKVILQREKENEAIIKFSDKMRKFDKFLEGFNTSLTIETMSPQNFDIPVTNKFIKTVRIDTKRDEKPTNGSENKHFLEKTVDINKDIQQSENPLSNPMIRSERTKRSTKILENDKIILRKLAIIAVEILDDLNDNNKRKQVVDIIDYKIEKQNDGTVLSLTVEVAPTDCNKKDNSTECLDEVILDSTQICKFDISINEKKLIQSSKSLHYSCKNKHKSKIRFKRQMVGNPRPYDVNDPKVQEYVQLGLQKYSQNYSGTDEPIISNVKEVTVQVVSGVIYTIKVDIGIRTCPKGVKDNCQLKTETVKECIINVWSQPWLDKGNPKVTVSCNENKRKKRSLKGKNYSQQMLQLSRQLKEVKLFHEFINKFNKNYATSEEKERRFKIFIENLDMIEELQRNEQGTGIYGVTKFTDLTKIEFKTKYLGLQQSLKSDNDIPLPKADIPDIKLPINYDWRHYNVVTPVKDQGGCGSCWAFSVTGNIEGQYAIKYGKLLSFSEQELIDCDKFDNGCNGGLPDTAYRAIEELGGLQGETDYPYEAENEKCHLNTNKIEVSVVSGLNITTNETQMAQWLVQNGPMSIGINANAMMFYVGGISHPYKFLCNPNDLDHGVLIVGYGIKSYPIFKKQMPYWLIKNSWGSNWGEQGYYRIYRGEGACGVNKMVTSAVVA